MFKYSFYYYNFKLNIHKMYYLKNLIVWLILILKYV